MGVYRKEREEKHKEYQIPGDLNEMYGLTSLKFVFQS
jgi:hypothetical protein